ARGFGLREGELPPRLDPERLDEAQREQLRAVLFMRNFGVARHLTNFPHFLLRTGVEKERKTITARKLLYQAEMLRLGPQPNDLLALRTFEDPRALQGWREVLDENPEFRADSSTQENTFEVELKYLRLYRRVHGAQLTRDLALGSFLGQAASPAPLGAD